MSATADLLAKLDPKTAKRFKTAQEAKVIRRPLASAGLTNALGGGIAAGRITLIYGNTSSGKTLLTLESIAQWQKQGLTCAFVDAEGTYDKAWAERLGVDNDELILISKKSFGAVFNEVAPLLENGLDILVVDSVSDLLPDAFLDDHGEIKEFDKQKQIGAHARSCTIFANAIHYVNYQTAVILLSQTTTDLSGMYPIQVPHGGKKLGFASSQIIKLTSSGTEKNQIMGEVFSGDKILQLPIGREVSYYVEKNKLGPQSRKGEYTLYYAGSNIGIDKVAELIFLGELFGVVSKGGAWYTYQDKQYQGSSKFTVALKEDPTLIAALHAEIIIAMNGGVIE